MRAGLKRGGDWWHIAAAERSHCGQLPNVEQDFDRIIAETAKAIVR